jgi:hypothetical protein
MKRSSKKLPLLLLLLTLPAVAQAQFTFTTTNGTITITGYTGSRGEVTIPSTINGLQVTSIADGAFWECTNLTSVSIPSSVTGLDPNAFGGCLNLGAITVDALNPGYSTVDGVLLDKRQTTLLECPVGKTGSCTIPSTVTKIEVCAFAGCASLTNVTIPNSVTNIGDEAFRFCSGLTSIIIPNRITYIGQLAFEFCTNLSTITVDTLNPGYSSANGLLFDKRQTTLIVCPGGKTGSLTIPSTVTNIEWFAFEDCPSLTSITIPNSVTSIGYGAFGDCVSLTNVTLSIGITTIPIAAFGMCISLASVTIPQSVTNIEWLAFSQCTNLTSLYFLGNAPNLGDGDVFSSDNHAIVYYLPGTTGWGSTIAGRPTALWNPSIQTTNASFGARTNRFGFTITGTTNIPIVVEASVDLATASWTPLQTCTLTNGSIYFSDPQWTNYPARFYRLRSP